MTDELENIKEINPFIIKRQVSSTEFDITLSEEVVSPPFKYAELCSVLRDEVKEDDIVNIHLSNYGGCCDSAATIVNAIKDCKGTVNVIVTAPSYSAATDIALSGDSLVLKPYSFLMFHNYSDEVGGKGGELKARLANQDRQAQVMMRDLYSPFLTKKEINDIVNDKDVYVHWDDRDLPERITNKFGDKEDE